MGSAGSDDWDWVFSPPADDQFASLESAVQSRIVSKLDEIVSSEWWAPEAFLEPLTCFRARASPFRARGRAVGPAPQTIGDSLAGGRLRP